MIKITLESGVVIKTNNKLDLLNFDNIVNIDIEPKQIYPIWLDENEKNNLVAHWEKTGMFSSIIQKIRATENTKRIL